LKLFPVEKKDIAMSAKRHETTCEAQTFQAGTRTLEHSAPGKAVKKIMKLDSDLPKSPPE